MAGQDSWLESRQPTPGLLVPFSAVCMLCTRYLLGAQWSYQDATGSESGCYERLNRALSILFVKLGDLGCVSQMMMTWERRVK